MKLKNGGINGINAKALKILSNLISDTHIFNLCIEQSFWPDALKVSEIVPLHKSGNKREVSNYRSISLISNLAKNFEKLIYNRLYDFISKNKLLSCKQYGFTKKRYERCIKFHYK